MATTYLGLQLELDPAVPADMIRMLDQNGRVVAESLTGHVAYQEEANGDNRIVKLVAGLEAFRRLSGAALDAE